MASHKEHCADCVRELGEPFEEVHAWLDALQPEYGPMHRPFRHNVEGVERVRRMWGDRAAEAARIHILKDCGGRLLTIAEYKEYWGIDLSDIEPEPD
jgi:hypothetical protein